MKNLKTLALLSLTLILLSGITATLAQTIWTGNTNTDWGNTSNWNPLFTPSSGDDIIIPTGRSNYPVINFSYAIKSLSIESGATITQNSGVLLVEGGQTFITGTYNQEGGILCTDELTVNAGGLLSIGNTTSSGPSLDVSGNFKNYSTVILNGGDVTLRGSVDNFVDGDLSIAGATVTSLGQDWLNEGSISISSGGLFLKKGDGTEVDKKIQIDGGTFTQTGGTVSTKDLVLVNGGTYNQSDGELQVDKDLKIPPGTTFASTGGTVRFTGDQGGKADYTGNVQFYNVVIDTGGKLNLDKDGDNIKIAGNFTNNNPNLDNTKGTVTFNGTTPQTISSASTPANTKSTFGNLVVTNPSGVSLLTDLGVETSFSYNSGGYLDLNENTLYVGGSIYGGPLPVELSSFSATTLENGVKLNWRTETEVSNYGFEILRQAQDDKWDVLGFIEGHGNSNSPKDYSFVDENVTTGNYSYRLKQIDTDGKSEYSKVIEVDLGSPGNYELSQNYPNPFNPSTTIMFSVLESSFINLSIFNSLGEKIEELVNEVKETGVHTIEFFAQDLPSGTYFYTINSNGYANTKKMILVK